MAQIGTIQVAGNANSTFAEVELNTLAARFVARPNDFTLWGHYRAAGNVLAQNANSTAALGSNLNLAGLSNSPAISSQVNSVGYRAGTLVAIKRIIIGYSIDIAGSGANGNYVFRFFRSKGSLTLGGSDVAVFGSKMRSTMPDAGAEVIQAADGTSGNNSAGLSSSATITEAQEYGELQTNITTTALSGGDTLGPWPLFDTDVSRVPIFLDQGQAVILQHRNTSSTPTVATTSHFNYLFEWTEYRLGDF